MDIDFREPIVNSFTWISDNEALVTWSNRYQNISIVTYCVAPSSFRLRLASIKCNDVHERETEGWIFKIVSLSFNFHYISWISKFLPP